MMTRDLAPCTAVVLYGDTDSMFVHLPSSNHDQESLTGTFERTCLASFVEATRVHLLHEDNFDLLTVCSMNKYASLQNCDAPCKVVGLLLKQTWLGQ